MNRVSKRSRGLVRGVLVLASCVVATGAVAEGLAGLRWLEGTWQRETSRGTAFESWRILSDSTFEGEAWRRAPSGERVPLEELRLVAMGGAVFYVPKVAENPYPVPFKLTSVGPGRAVFENPQHDFPTKIGYELDAETGALNVWTEGPGEGGKPRRIDFRFSRAKEPAQEQAGTAVGGP